MQEQAQQFEVIETQAQGAHSFRQLSPFDAVLRGCMEMERELVREYLQATVKEIMERAQHNHQHQDSCCQIITVQFLKNQLQDLAIFVKMVTTTIEQQKHLIFTDLPPSKVDHVLLMKSEVREIVLNMHIYLQENPQFDLVVFIVNEISDLDEWNMYCFEKGLRGKRLVLIICGHHEFENRHENISESFEKLHFKLYNAKDLFCQFLYNCLASPVIKPYLPPEVLTLVTDMDYYSISYKEACRRFRFCVERGLMLYRKERVWVDFVELVRTIETALVKEITHYPGYKGIAKDKWLKAILTDEELLHIPEKAIVYEITLRPVNQGLIEEQDILNCMRGHVKRSLARNESFKKYIEYLDEVKAETAAPKAGRRKKSRSQQLGIDTKKTMTPKHLLETQLTRIIKDATAGIRQQAAHISWEDINYELRIKPQLPYLIKEAWAADLEASDLVEAVTRNYSAPLTHFLKDFENKELGKGIYLIKCLEMAGLIDIRKSQVKPMVYNTFFDKANFKVLS